MKKTNVLLRILALISALILSVSLFCACAPSENTDSVGSNPTQSESSDPIENKITITVEVVKADGSKKEWTIKTDATTLRGALDQENLIAGDDSEFGLYVKTVDGERADYTLDGAYWAFSKNGEMLMTGVDSTNIADGEHYEITYTKA